MPRLPSHRYLIIHTYLRQWWLTVPRVYGELSARDQWYLHDYFRPSHEESELVLRAHRVRISQERPSLPQCAGRAFAEFERQVERIHGLIQQGATSSRHARERHVRIVVVVKPEPDAKRLAQVLIEQALRQVADEDRERGAR